MRGLAFALLLACTPAPRAEVVKAAHPHAEALAVLEGDAREAFLLLADADSFTSAHTGYSGRLSPYAAALRLLVRHPNAQIAVGALWQSENRVARLYALAGFWYLRPMEYRAAVESLRGDETRIETLSGCVGGERTVSALLAARHAEVLAPGTGKSDLQCLEAAPGQTLDPGYLAISLIEGENIQLSLCSRPSEEWPRLNLPAAWPNVEAERELQRLREEADLNPPAPIDYEQLVRLVEQGGAVVSE